MKLISQSGIEKPQLYAPLTLAIIGDSVYDLYVRTRLSEGGSLPTNTIHKTATSYVKAAAQAKSAHAIMQMLTEEEVAIFKRGRNAHSATVPKNASISDYRTATGFEAVIGMLDYLNENERIEELLAIACEADEGDKNDTED